MIVWLSLVTFFLIVLYAGIVIGAAVMYRAIKPYLALASMTGAIRNPAANSEMSSQTRTVMDALQGNAPAQRPQGIKYDNPAYVDQGALDAAYLGSVHASMKAPYEEAMRRNAGG